MPSYGQSHILAYHMVGDYQSKFIPAMSIHRFQKEIEYLHAHYEIIPLSDLVHKLNEKKNINRCIAITFDDGFADNYTIAYPALKRYDIPATIFLLPEHIDILFRGNPGMGAGFYCVVLSRQTKSIKAHGV